MHRSKPCVAILAVLAAGLWLGQTALAQPVANWNQERVTKIAQNLAAAAEELKEALSAEPRPNTPGNQQRAHYEAREDVRLLANTAKHLANRLSKGATRAETMPIVKRLGVLRRDAEENGRKALIQDSTFDRIVKVGSLLLQLAPYYNEA